MPELPRGCKTAGAILAIGIMFTCLGTCAGGPLLIESLTDWLITHNWTPTPCTIVRFGIDPGEPSNSSDMPNSPDKVDVEFRYQVGDKSYTSTRYFWEGNIASNRSITDYAAGVKATCYVNPNDPAQAVLDRGPGANLKWIWVLGLVLVGVVIIQGVRGKWSLPQHTSN